MTQKQQFKSWDQYTEEAQLPPFELPVSKDETLIFPALSGAALIQFQRAYRAGDDEAMLMVLAGDQWEKVEPLLAKAGHGAFRNLVIDMMLYFDLAEEVEMQTPDGRKVYEKDPRTIKNKLRQGYRVVGEAGSRT
ncbi:hypothetical protein AB0K08_13545 [Citricoccus sp. NPDC055426]|uniref:hypothetical protein n=1 Tax=Citricoccus sp. NPDC055426 TaxID=3155536 RepID=UPI00342135F9